MTQAQPLNARQREFLRLYIGRNTRYRGNATACYAKAYDCSDKKTAQACGSRLTTTNPHIKAAIERANQKAMDNLGIDATFVLQESLHLYDVALGNVAIEVDQITKDGSVVPVEVRSLDLGVASRQLDQIGRHTSVQAFQDNVNHSHTHYLEQRLAQRHRELEAKATPIDVTAEAELIENTGAGAPGEGKKRVHLEDGTALVENSQEKTTQPAGRASGK